MWGDGWCDGEWRVSERMGVMGDMKRGGREEVDERRGVTGRERGVWRVGRKGGRRRGGGKWRGRGRGKEVQYPP